MNRYAFHPEAYGDLAEHWAYIAEHGSIDAADRVIADVFEALDTTRHRHRGVSDPAGRLRGRLPGREAGSLSPLLPRPTGR